MRKLVNGGVGTERRIVTRIGKKKYEITSDDEYLYHIGRNFEVKILRLFDSLTTHGQYVLDVGANIGCTSIFLGEKAKQIFCFEPSPTTYKFLEKNISTSGRKNITCINAGLGRRTEESELTFAATDRSGGFVSNQTKASQGHVVEKISILNGDEFIQFQKMPQVDFIKIDVEGFEKDVIEGLSATIGKFHPIVALELNHWCLNAYQRISVPDFLDFLRNIFPYLYAVDKDTVKNLHNPDEAYHVMYSHITLNFKYPTIVGAFDHQQLSKFSETYRINIERKA